MMVGGRNLREIEGERERDTHTHTHERTRHKEYLIMPFTYELDFKLEP